jgi:hypothetical protein
MRMPTRRLLLGGLAAVLVIEAVLVGYELSETREAQPTPLPSPVFLPSDSPIVQPTVRPTARPTPTVFSLGPLVDPSLDLKAGPVEVPLELQIPKLHITAPVVGVGLTPKNLMDSPKGPIGDAIWHTAFWFRGGGIPGEVGTATIAGHVNDPLGRPEIFANLGDLHPGDVIVIRYLDLSHNIQFTVKEIKVYSLKESTDPAVLTRIFGAGPVAGTGPQPAPDGLSHLTLLTCAGDIANGQFDHHTVVFATRSK